MYDPIWHVNSSSGVATLVSELLYPCYLIYFDYAPCWRRLCLADYGQV